MGFTDCPEDLPFSYPAFRAVLETLTLMVSLTSRLHTNGIVEAAVARHGTALDGWGRTAPDDRTSHSESEVTEGEGEREREEGGELERSTRGSRLEGSGLLPPPINPPHPPSRLPFSRPGAAIPSF